MIFPINHLTTQRCLNVKERFGNWTKLSWLLWCLNHRIPSTTLTQVVLNFQVLT